MKCQTDSDIFFKYIISLLTLIEQRILKGDVSLDDLGLDSNKYASTSS